MSYIKIKNVQKKYNNNTVIKDISLEIDKGEFIVILGPSGCGKTTLLRILAGFEHVDDGEFYLNNNLLSSPTTHIAPENRNINIVFQNYALWPHMTVYDNVSYSLKIKKLSKQEIEQKTLAVLEQVELSHLLNRYPSELSGGQRQRVALARCLISESPVVLLDEPLANLDVYLKNILENDFINFHKESRATLIYITHDQKEAMALADKIVVMKDGHIMQFDTPYKLYTEPQNEMVASFIGDGKLCEIHNIIPIGNGFASALIDTHEIKVRCHKNQKKHEHGLVCLHTTDIEITDKSSKNAIAVKVNRIIYRGSFYQIDTSLVHNDKETLTIHSLTNNNINQDDIIYVNIKNGWILPL